MRTLYKKGFGTIKRGLVISGGKRRRARGKTDTRGCPGVGGFSASLSEEMSSASPNRSSAAAAVLSVEQHGRRTTLKYTCPVEMPNLTVV